MKDTDPDPYLRLTDPDPEPCLEQLFFQLNQRIRNFGSEVCSRISSLKQSLGKV
jgi:hypothetical protein